ncbi:MAG: hypothetical protein M3O30_18325 [Planctomycetota bacterium]|nr:hypothetical protein [Planctomycetota bacterium]
MSETNDKPECVEQGEPGDAKDVAIAAGVGGTLGLTIGFLAAGPFGAIALGLLYAGQAALCAATGHGPEATDIS